MRNSAIIYFAFLLFFVSCSDKSGGSAGEQSSPVVTLEPTSVNPIGATLGGSIQNFSVGEITRGEFGILLSETTSEQSQDQFRFLDWKDSGNMEGISKFRASTLKSGTDYAVEVKDLIPGKEYLTCAFFTDKNDKRMIGQVVRFQTPAAEFRAVTERVESPGYINASLSGTIKTNLPLDKLSYGVVWYDAPGQTNLELGHVVSGRKISADDGGYSVDVTYLHAGTTYYYRSYVCYDGEYSYGDELSFTTRNADEMTVDLGLSVLWADCNLGATSWEEDGLALAWGELTDNGSGSIKSYKYYVDDQFVDIGKEISGTEYDAAHVYLGGKWRMPTNEELKELLNSCNHGFVNPGAISVYDKILRITATNGNNIQFTGYKLHGDSYNGDQIYHYSEKSFQLASGTLLTVVEDKWHELWREYLLMKSHYCSVNLQKLQYSNPSNIREIFVGFQRNVCVPIRPVRDRD